VAFLTSEKNWFGKIFRAVYRNSQCLERGNMKKIASKLRAVASVELCSH
jgi:hypothetical protein